MGKRRQQPPVHTQEQCDVWLSTADKKEQAPATKRQRVMLFRSISNITNFTVSSHPIKAGTKQTNIQQFFGHKTAKGNENQARDVAPSDFLPRDSSTFIEPSEGGPRIASETRYNRKVVSSAPSASASSGRDDSTFYYSQSGDGLGGCESVKVGKRCKETGNESSVVRKKTSEVEERHGIDNVGKCSTYRDFEKNCDDSERRHTGMDNMNEYAVSISDTLSQKDEEVLYSEDSDVAMFFLDSQEVFELKSNLVHHRESELSDSNLTDDVRFSDSQAVQFINDSEFEESGSQSYMTTRRITFPKAIELSSDSSTSYSGTSSRSQLADNLTGSQDKGADPYSIPPVVVLDNTTEPTCHCSHTETVDVVNVQSKMETAVIDRSNRLSASCSDWHDFEMNENSVLQMNAPVGENSSEAILGSENDVGHTYRSSFSQSQSMGTNRNGAFKEARSLLTPRHQSPLHSNAGCCQKTKKSEGTFRCCSRSKPDTEKHFYLDSQLASQSTETLCDHLKVKFVTGDSESSPQTWHHLRSLHEDVIEQNSDLQSSEGRLLMTASQNSSLGGTEDVHFSVGTQGCLRRRDSRVPCRSKVSVSAQSAEDTEDSNIMVGNEGRPEQKESFATNSLMVDPYEEDSDDVQFTVGTQGCLKVKEPNTSSMSQNELDKQSLPGSNEDTEDVSFTMGTQGCLQISDTSRHKSTFTSLSSPDPDSDSEDICFTMDTQGCLKVKPPEVGRRSRVESTSPQSDSVNLDCAITFIDGSCDPSNSDHPLDGRGQPLGQTKEDVPSRSTDDEDSLDFGIVIFKRSSESEHATLGRTVDEGCVSDSDNLDEDGIDDFSQSQV